MGSCMFLFRTFIVIEFTWYDGGILTLNVRTFVLEICFTIQDEIFYWLGIFDYAWVDFWINLLSVRYLLISHHLPNHVLGAGFFL